jgi:DNA-binding MarR family transcriptional regulator
VEGARPSGLPVDAWPLTALLRGARSVFANAIRGALVDAGFQDLPPNGPFVVAAVSATETPLADVIRQLGVSKQAAGQLVDTLVARGYLERTGDPSDRRRLVLRLTERSVAAGQVIRDVSARLESEIANATGSHRLATTREVLAEVIEHAEIASRGTHDGSRSA